MKGISLHLRMCRNGNLTASAHGAEHGAFAGCRLARSLIIEKAEMLLDGFITGTGLNAKRALPCRWTHLLRSQDLAYPFGLAQPLQASNSKNDGVILSSLKFAHTSIHIAA